MDHYYKFEDSEIVMSVPEYLQKKKGQRYFAPRRRRGQERGIYAMSVEMISDKEDADDIRSGMRAFAELEWMGVRKRIVRRGGTKYVSGGYELLSTSVNTVNGTVLHDYEAIIAMGNRFVSIGISGCGDVDLFDGVCREIVSSIRVKD
jgi:hypothetical protein